MNKEVTSLNCSDCGKVDKLNWMKDVIEVLIARNLCATCNFWFNYILKIDNPRAVRIHNEHYWIGEEHPPYDTFIGHGGQKFKILFQNGREVITTNLWSQGVIPPRFRSRLPDNAEFRRVIK